MLFTPSLLFLFPVLDPEFPRLDVNQAIAMGLIVEFVGYSSAAVGYVRERRVAFDPALGLLLVTVPTAVLLSSVGAGIPDRGLLFVFGLILFVLAFLFVRFHRQGAQTALSCCAAGRPDPKRADGGIKTLRDRSGVDYRYRFEYGSMDLAASLSGGAFVGLTGVGLGEIITTLLAVHHRFPLHLATASSVFIVAVTVLAAALSHVYLLFQKGAGLPWNLVVIMISAVMIGGQIAPGLARKFSEGLLRKVLVSMFFVVGLLMVLRALAPQG